jgi:competence protein ComEA
MKRLSLLLTLLLICISRLHAAEPLEEFPGCKWVPTPWGDGDSFQIRTADGTTKTIRLYGADCIEQHVNDNTDATRLAAQRRYFGISEWGGSAQSSIAAAKDLGRQATEETGRLLARPFTVHTAHANARGDSRYPRVYAFVTTAEGVDLAEHLVRAGLARAFGVTREMATGKSGKDYQAGLHDAELVAAKAGIGVWAKTDWQRLSQERQLQRQHDEELGMATHPKPAKGIPLDPNTAARADLMKIPGIGEVTADRIIRGRPYRKLTDLLKVEGIGPKSLERFESYLHIPAAN